MLRNSVDGDYQYLPGIPAFSSGVVATQGFEIVHVTLRALVPWREGFARIERHLKDAGRPRTALCGIELRIPGQFTPEGFNTFNDGYRSVLGEWGILRDGGENPIPRTNVSPVAMAPKEASLYAFDYTIPGVTPSPTFIVAGAGEMRDRGRNDIVRRGETSPDAMKEKARFVMTIMGDRLRGLGGDWSRVTALDVYTAYPIQSFLIDELLTPAGPAGIHGVRWFPSRPPVEGLEFELDMRGVGRELVI
jgi:hypothetical protein